MSARQMQAEQPIDKLEAARQLSTPDLEQFVSRVIVLQAQRRAPSLSARKTELLLKINNGLPEKTHARYRTLIRKRRAASLTEKEHTELLRLADESELMQAERLDALAELARLRDTTPRELMATFGIKPSPVG